MLRHDQYKDRHALHPLPSESIIAMRAAVKRYLAVTRPQQDFVGRLDGELTKAELLATTERNPSHGMVSKHARR